MLPDFAIQSFLNDVLFFIGEDNLKKYPFFINFQLESDPKHIRHAGLSLMVLELIAVKIYGIAKCGNDGLRLVKLGSVTLDLKKNRQPQAR